MGCWNKTCGISQFPLVSGDKTVNFILVEAMMKYRDSTPCYPSGMGWKLIPIPFYGEYNDYGWQEDDDGQQPKYDFLAQHYKDQIVEVESEKKRAKLCYGKMNGPFDNNETLGDSIHGNVWNLANSFGAKYGGPESRRMASFMISRIVWDALTSRTMMEYPQRKWVSRKQLAESLDGYLKFVNAKEAEMKKAQEAADKDDPKAQASAAIAEMQMMLRMLDMGHDQLASEYIETKFGGRGYGDPRAGVINFCNTRMSSNESMEMVIGKPLKAGVITSEDVSAVYLLESAMYSLRKGYHPQTGEGSQNGIDHNHHLLLTAMRDMIRLDKIRYGDHE